MARTERKYDMRPAVREDTPLLISLFAPPGAGKTYSALRLATGIQSVVGGDIIVIDTEAGRALHYADKFRFQHIDFKPPFGSLDYLDVIRQAAALKPAVVVVDSFSHEHIGEGGYLMAHEEWVDRFAGPQGDWKKREACSMAAWAKVAPLRTQMIQGITQIRGRFIFTFRAKEKTKPVKGEGGKTEIVDMGFMPQAGDELLYEMTASILLHPRANGVATWATQLPGEKLMLKLPEQFKEILNTGKPITEETGAFMANWARGGVKAPLSDLPPAWNDWTDEERGENRARKGSVALKEWWLTLTPAKQKSLASKKDTEWKLTANTADATSSS
jgi:AAA domain-containing protein